MHKDRPTFFATDRKRWNAVRERDPLADGKFYYAVKTTGVYCRPTCGARLARRENVTFHDSCVVAEAAGFRPCKRCHPNGPTPDQQLMKRVTAVCRLIETAEEVPVLAKLAETARMSPYYFHRVFKKITGLTPKRYAATHRARKIRQELPRRESVTEAIYEAGYHSNSRFYEKSSEVLGMKPKKYREGGRDTLIRFAVGECSLGSVLVASTEKGVCAIFLGDDPDELARNLQDRFRHATLIGGDAAYEQVVALVAGLVDEPQTQFDLPLDIRGTVFQERVWQALREIPPGQTTSYTQIAQSIRMPKAVRAVAQACGANPIAVVIPCHRVVRMDGNLSGYRWGVERKRALLKKEMGTNP